MRPMFLLPLSCPASPQAGHEIILQCECDPGAQQVRARPTQLTPRPPGHRWCRPRAGPTAARIAAAWRHNQGHAAGLAVTCGQDPPAHAHRPHCCCSRARTGPVPPRWQPHQVLKRAFPGVLLVPDICGLESLPQVRWCVAPAIGSAQSALGHCCQGWPALRDTVNPTGLTRVCCVDSDSMHCWLLLC
jgi:hypothetical protein